jgi:hypothetical protein
LCSASGLSARQNSNNEAITFYTTGDESLVLPAIRSEPEIELPTSYNGAYEKLTGRQAWALAGVFKLTRTLFTGSWPRLVKKLVGPAAPRTNLTSL